MYQSMYILIAGRNGPDGHNARFVREMSARAEQSGTRTNNAQGGELSILFVLDGWSCPPCRVIFGS